MRRTIFLIAIVGWFWCLCCYLLAYKFLELHKPPNEKWKFEDWMFLLAAPTVVPLNVVWSFVITFRWNLKQRMQNKRVAQQIKSKQNLR